MYALTTHQTQQTSGGLYGLSIQQMQYVTTMAFAAVPQVILPLAFKSANMDSESLKAKTITNIFSILATGSGFLAGNNLFSEPEKAMTVVYQICANQTITG